MRHPISFIKEAVLWTRGVKKTRARRDAVVETYRYMFLVSDSRRTPVAQLDTIALSSPGLVVRIL